MTLPRRVELEGRTYVLERPGPRPRRADSMTTSIKFSAAEFDRLAEAAHRSGMTRHGIMRLAILYYLDGVESEDGERAAGATPKPPPPGKGLTAAMARLIGQGVHPLRAVRGGRGFTTLRLAARLNDLGLDIDETLITQIEEDEVTPTPELRAALAKALGVEEEVLGG